MASADYFRVLVGGTGLDGGYSEIATSGDGNEQIYVRQYTGEFSSITRTATLLDESGFTVFPKAICCINVPEADNSISSGWAAKAKISTFMLI
jgi:hypothetical protein